jgi:hypothetical protein
MNYGGAPKFVKGPWKAGYTLGTYGIDPVTQTAWAVIHYNGEFAVSQFRSHANGHWNCRLTHR